MEVPQIENLRDFLNQKVVHQTVTRLTAPGDNFGSLMLKLDVKLENDEILHTVAKMLPKEDSLREIFHCNLTFRGEINFYKIIVPALQNFRKEWGLQPLDCFPDYIAGRTNLKGSIDDELDEQAVLILENLKIKGYTLGERTKGLDYDTTLKVLEKMAQFHATGIALKFKRPEIFNKDILPLFNEIVLFKGPPNYVKLVFDSVSAAVKNDNELSKYKQKITEIMEDTYKSFAENPKNSKYKDINNFWPTIIHTDAWVNNILLKISNGKCENVKLVDFQAYEFGSPVKDVLFFLFDSTENEVFNKHFDHLLELYHDKLTTELGLLDCYKEEFSYENFQEQLKINTLEYELTHALHMLTTMYDENPSGSFEIPKIPKKQITRIQMILKKCIETNLLQLKMT